MRSSGEVKESGCLSMQRLQQPWDQIPAPTDTVESEGRHEAVLNTELEKKGEKKSPKVHMREILPPFF